MQSSKIDRIKDLVEQLNAASESYYAKDQEIMSNYEYDKLYDELVELEKETGVTLANSPTVNVGYEAVDELPKERHESPMLSLGKTKSREELRDWLQGNPAILSWKLDGLTIVLTYREGKLAKAVTRGNGEIGEVITNNARTFKNLPLNISYTGELILRGEAVITYSDFEKINGEIADAEAKYKNPRNLCSGSVRQLNNEITARRNVRFFAFTLVKADGVDFHDSKEAQFAFLQEQGFAVVEHVAVTEENILSAIEDFEHKIEHYDIPSDGLVLTYESISYGQSLGRTAKFPRDSIAFKWADELRETTLKEVEWSASRTGLINPVAIFEPVELEGTTVSRASVHNISIMRSLRLGIGDHITVYKANMIIPQIAENLTGSDNVEIPKVCPVCGQPTEIRQMNEVQSLYCTNEKCPAKEIKSYTLFVSRDALNIDGLSEATLEKLIDQGFIHEYADLFRLFGCNMKDGNIGKISENRFARADLEHTLLCVDDDMRMEALRQTNYVKSIVTAQGQMDLERKGKQSYQGWMYARLLAFSNGDLQALYDRSDGFYRRQLILTTKDKLLSRVDDPDIAEKIAAEAEGILLWAFEGLQRLVKNGFQFTESDRAKRNRELVKRDNNNVFDFLESEGYIRLKADACTSSKELYEVYKMWCEENSLNAIKARGFSDALIANQRRYNLESTNNIVNASGRRVRGFFGIEALVQPDLTPNGWRA